MTQLTSFEKLCNVLYIFNKGTCKREVGFKLYHPMSRQWDILTLSQTSPDLYVSTSLLKTLGKGEIAHNKHFLLFLQCFLAFSELTAIFI